MEQFRPTSADLERLFSKLLYYGKVKSQTDFGEKLGWKRSFTSKVLRGNEKIPEDLVNKVSNVFSILPENWISDNKSTIQSNAKFIGDLEREQFYLGKHNTYREISDEGNYTIIVPFLSVKAAAGYLLGWGDDDYMQTLPKVEFTVDELHRGEYIAIEASGDSMFNGSYESIADGDKMLCRKLRRDLWLNAKLHLNDYNPDFVIHHRTEGLIVKRIIEHNVKEGYIVCHSLNPDKDTYPDFSLEIEDIAQIFTVVQTLQTRKRK